MAENRFTFNVQRLPVGPAYADSFQEQNLYELNFCVFLFF